MSVASEHPAPAAGSWQKVAQLSHALDYQPWLEAQCELIDRAYAGLLVAGASAAELKPVAVWPEANQGVKSLTDLVEHVIEDGEGLVTELQDSYGIAYPVISGSELIAVMAVAVAANTEEELAAVMRELQWGASWLELRHTRQLYQDREASFSRLSTSIDLLARVLPESGFDQAAMRLVTELAINLNSDLVSIGFVERQGVKLAHLSHSAEFGRQMNLVRNLENAMDESLDQRAPILFPALQANANLVTVAHTVLADMQEQQSIMTVPLVVADQWVGAITLQRDIDQPFTVEDLRYCESVVALAVSALEDKRHNDRPLRVKIRDEIEQQVIRLTGPGYVGRKLVLGVSTLVILLLLFWQGDYRLSADAVLQTTSQRVIVAPFEGYIKDASARAGDVVAKGDVLLSLDDRDLQLEQLRWRSQQNKLEREYQEAIAGHDRARITILDAQLSQARAQLELVQSQLQRATQRAPFDGLIVSGDLSQRLGGTVTHGESLLEISPVDAYRVKLLVKESRIADVSVGQQGSVYLSALPEQAFEFTVDNITPVTEYQDGSTFFVVEALLHNNQGSQDIMRPGMEGVGKVFIDRRNQFGIWTRELVEWMRLGIWRWWG